MPRGDKFGPAALLRVAACPLNASQGEFVGMLGCPDDLDAARSNALETLVIRAFYLLQDFAGSGTLTKLCIVLNMSTYRYFKLHFPQK